MTPIAAYFIFTADEQQRAVAAAHEISPRRARPSLFDRVRAVAAAMRPRPSLTRPT
jgi:hypothetical protein